MGITIKRINSNAYHIYPNESYYGLYDNEGMVGGFTLSEENDDFYVHLEHISRKESYKGHGCLKTVIDYIFNELKVNKLTCMLLEQYRAYYESLDFKKYKELGEDIYYIKEKENDNTCYRQLRLYWESCC